MDIVHQEYNLYLLEIEKKSQCFCLTLYYNNKEKTKQFMFKRTDVAHIADIIQHQRFLLPSETVSSIVDKLNQFAACDTVWC